MKLKAISLYLAFCFTSTPLLAAEPVATEKATADAPAEAEKEPDLNETTLTGDWGGRRSAWAKSGFVIESAFKIDSLDNKGGTLDGRKSMTNLDIKLKADFEKLTGWEGTTGMIHILDNGGAGLNAQRVGSQVGVSNIEVGNVTTRLFQAWMQKSFNDGQFAILAGLYPIDTEFFGMDSAGVFLGSQYGTPADLAQTRNGAASVFNNSAFGVRLKWQAADKTLYTQAAVLDGIPNDPLKPKNTAILFNKGDGVFHIGEIGYLPQAANEKFQGHSKYALGLWGYSAKVNDQLDVDVNGVAVRRSSYGGYILGEQTLLRLDADGGRFLSGFARYTWTDGDSTQLTASWNLGLHLRGPFASRPDDILGFAYTHARESAKYKTSQINAGTPMEAAEQALELTYRIQITPWLALQPNIQNIKNPGGSAAARTANLVGARLEVVF